MMKVRLSDGQKSTVVSNTKHYSLYPLFGISGEVLLIA